ncbi:cobalamin-binding domain-containing protein [Deltaproteobacteria bacterium]|nr:cobalamin-binding domain-containing protein [Deltaproteobacteria bacterium]
MRDRQISRDVVCRVIFERIQVFMDRDILLVEPDFKTKFPPLGLMKISAYHKKLGDNVIFVKGISHSVEYEYWDRIYVSTLFTYHWPVTIKTINFYKRLVKNDPARIVIGGILASLLPNEIWRETGIKPLTGVLSDPGVLDDNDLIVENMVPDYELFNGVSPIYSLIDDSFFGYSTRGCPNSCKFCGVHILEPKFIDYKGIKPYVKKINELYGDKPKLVLFDNNILASKQFENVIEDIIDLGFGKGEKFQYTKNGRTISKQRRVDFNQGTDSRLMKEAHLKLFSRIALNPLRIAFDHIKDEKKYCEGIYLAAKHKIQKLSNYILYNFNDTPEDLWKRLKINIELNKELDLKIYSFPMKYIPLNAKDRSYINEPSWNWQFIRGVQRILNVLKGTVMTSEDFFYRAFGQDENEFLEILHMPEKILLYRGHEPKSLELEWQKKFRKLTNGEKTELLILLCNNRTKSSLVSAAAMIKNGKVKKILEYYLPEKEGGIVS